MVRLLLLLLPIICIVQLTTGISRCPRSNPTNFAATHHNKKHPSNSNDGGQDQGSASGTVKRSAERGQNMDRDRVRRDTVTCDSTHPYRYANGTCNNINNPYWGSVDQTFLRLLDPVYDDGLKTPRLKQENGDYLPSPRTISTTIHTFDFNRYHPVGSVLLMNWGQFLAHDITGTVIDVEGLAGSCCSDDLVTGTALHSDVLSGGPCFPIIIPQGDNYFKEVSTRCMQFVRSYPVTDSKGVRQQKSELSAYIDGTNIYGLTDDAMTALRTMSDGKLKVKNDDFLTQSTENSCILTDSNDYCFDSGDNRVNAYPGLGALHTIFHRYHNYVADQLKIHHTDYNDEKLFQEARKIVIAVLQKITYSEYLPLILGADAMTTYGLNADWSYDATCDATLYNVFSTAAFRFGHSMVPDYLAINGTNYYSRDLYLRPYHVLNNLDSLLQGMATNPSEKADRWYSQGMTNKLFEMTDQDGFDVASLNIQRGRDHGLPPYNKWREFCGLRPLSVFAEMGSSRAYRKAYADVDDVDLYSGGLSENGQGSVGDTYKCLLGKQFQRLRNCDRFWWETTDTTVGFPTDAARAQIQKTRLSHIICLTTGITSIQRSVLRVPSSDGNSVESCADLLTNGADYSLF